MRGEIKTMQDRREVRNFRRFLRLWPRYELRMLQSPRWQRYLGLAASEAWRYAKGRKRMAESAGSETE